MKIRVDQSDEVLKSSVQINDGLSDTSADGASLAFDVKYGIMFCSYMPGPRGRYGESRGRVCLSYFPASQPTNIRFIEIASGHDEYCNNILSLGDGKVRVFYEKNSLADCDHEVCYKDFDALTGVISNESVIQVIQDDGSLVPLCFSSVTSYLKNRGFDDQIYMASEQVIVGGCTIFRGDDGYVYGSATSYLAEPVLFRSRDDLKTIEFFAVYPELVQYEFDYKMFNGKIYALFRTDRKKDSISFTTSSDMGKTWSTPHALEDSITCRPRIILLGDRILISYNVYNTDTGYRPYVRQGRTAVRMRLGENEDPRLNDIVADIHSIYGIVNVSLVDIMGDVYFAYSTSVVPLEYQNYHGPNVPTVAGKDSMRYVKLGALG